MQATGPSERAAAWVGTVLIGLFLLTPVVGWLGPLAFAPVMALAGLLTLRWAKVEEADRPAAFAVIVILLWAVGSSVWSPHQPEDLESSTALKLVLQVPTYWAVIHAARIASPARGRIARHALAWGVTLFALIMLVEAFTGAGIYQYGRVLLGTEAIRPDLAMKNVAQSGFVLTLLAPAAILAGSRVGVGYWLALPIGAGILASSLAFGSDAPVIAVVFAALAALATWRSPIWAPRVMGGLVAFLFLAAPGILWITRHYGLFDALKAAVPLSWSQRMGYWSHAADWISDHPLRGWGLDASRSFSPGIRLHPHDAALQIWLELGLIGAVAAAVFWAVVLGGQSTPDRDPARVTRVATAVTYLTFAAVSFGVWQEWWLAAGALAATACALSPLRQASPAAARA